MVLSPEALAKLHLLKTCNGRPTIPLFFSGNTVDAHSIPAVLPQFLVPPLQYYRQVQPHYQGCSRKFLFTGTLLLQIEFGAF